MDNKIKKQINNIFVNYYKLPNKIEENKKEILKQQSIKATIEETFALPGCIGYDDMPHAHNNCEAEFRVLNLITRKDEQLEKLDKRIESLQAEIVEDLAAYNVVSDFVKTLTEKEYKVFVMLYKDNLTAIDIAYKFRYNDERYVYKLKSDIINKYSNFVA